MKYLFNTSVTSNSDKYWIDRDIIEEHYINASNLKEALQIYLEKIAGVFEISKSAIKNKRKMYRDTANKEGVQVGYCITGKTGCYDDYKYKEFYVTLWIEIFEINRPKF